MQANTKFQIKDNKKIYEARIDMLQKIDKLCQENGLTYFAFGALLEGIIHYQDLTPDDIESPLEIGFLRKDYDEFTQLIKEKANELELVVVDKNKNSSQMINLIVGKNIIWNYEDIEVTFFVSIKIAVFDFVPESEAQQKYFLKKAFDARNKYIKASNLLATTSEVPLKLREAADIFLTTLFNNKRNTKKLFHKMEKIVTEYDDTGYVARLLDKRTTIYKIEDFFPIKKRKLGDIEVNCPNNHKKWTVEIDDELIKQTKTIQKIDLVIMKEFDRVCREIGVGYFICGGTMLGYMRHGGFIPWDDDVDCGMLRADYDKFIEEAPKYLNQDFFLQTRASDPKIPYLFSKIRMNETEYITNYNELRDFHKGICLDIFPFDYIPESKNERFNFLREIETRKNIHNYVTNRHLEKPRYKSPTKTSKEKYARFANEIRRLLIHIVSLKTTQKFYIKKATQYNKVAKEKNLTTVASFVPTYTYASVEDMIPYQDIEFEGIKMMALKDMDKFLTMQYGDYMQLPPLHLRVGHDLIRWGISDKMAKKYNIYEE